MKQMVKNIIEEALANLETQYEGWKNLRKTSKAELELAEIKLSLIEEACRHLGIEEKEGGRR